MSRLPELERTIIKTAEPCHQQALKVNLDDWMEQGMPGQLSDFVTFDYKRETAIAIHTLEALYRGLFLID